MNDLDPLLTTREIAAYLAVSVETVLRLCRSGEIPAVRVGSALRFDRAAVLARLEEKQGKAPPPLPPSVIPPPGTDGDERS